MAYTSFGQVIPVTGPNLGFPGNVSRLTTPVITARQVLPTTPSNLSFGGVAIGIGNSQGGYWIPAVDFLSAPQVVTTGSITNTSTTITNLANTVGLVIGMAVSGTGVGANATIVSINQAASSIVVSVASSATTASVTLTFAVPTGNGATIVQYFAGIANREVKTQLTYPYGGTPGAIQQVGYYAPGELAEVIELGSITVTITNGTPVCFGPVYLRVVANVSLPGTAIGDLEASADLATSGLTMGTTIGSATITTSAGTGIVIGQYVVGAGIPANTVVLSGSGTSWVLSNAATQTVASGVAVAFNNCIPLPDTQFRTGVLDPNNIAEISILKRHLA